MSKVDIKEALNNIFGYIEHIKELADQNELLRDERDSISEVMCDLTESIHEIDVNLYDAELIRSIIEEYNKLCWERKFSVDESKLTKAIIEVAGRNRGDLFKEELRQSFIKNDIRKIEDDVEKEMQNSIEETEEATEEKDGLVDLIYKPKDEPLGKLPKDRIMSEQEFGSIKL